MAVSDLALLADRPTELSLELQLEEFGKHIDGKVTVNDVLVSNEQSLDLAFSFTDDDGSVAIKFFQEDAAESVRIQGSGYVLEEIKTTWKALANMSDLPIQARLAINDLKLPLLNDLLSGIEFSQGTSQAAMELSGSLAKPEMNAYVGIKMAVHVLMARCHP